MLKKAIILQLKKGSEEAFNLLYHKYSPLIKQICFFYVKDNAHSEDLTIVTFIKLWNSRANIDVNKNIKYYLTQIAHNLCRDYLRKTSREKTVYISLNELERIASSPVDEIQDNKQLFK